MIDIRKIQCERVLSPTGMRQADYVINPYRGCQFGCTYCYAQSTRFAQKQKSPWGSFVDVKLNALDVLERELAANPPGRIMIGSITEVYQPAEAEYKLTRQILERLVDTDHSVLLLTKSNLISRDIDVLSKLRKVLICFTVNTIQTSVIRAFEQQSPSYEARCDAIRKLHEAGVPTYIHAGPFLPYFTDPQQIMSDLAPYAQRFDFENLNLKMVPWQKLQEIVRTHWSDLLPDYQGVYADETSFDAYWNGVRETIIDLGKKFDRETNVHFHPYDSFFPISVNS